MIRLLTILAQIKLEGFEETAELGPLFAILVSMIIILAAAIIILFRQNEIKDKKLEKTIKDNAEKMNNIHSDHANKISEINIKNTDKLEEIRIEMIQKEEKRNKEYRESEKETLQVLNGVSSVLEMGEKMNANDNKQIISKLDDLKKILEKK